MAPCAKPCPCGAVVDADLVPQRVFVGGEILVDFERVSQRDQRHQVGGRHLLLQEIARRLHAAFQVFGLHRRQIKEHDDQAMIAQVFGTSHDHGLVARPLCPRGKAADRGLVQRSGHIHALKIERGDLLLLAVLVDAEVALLEPAHQLACLGIARHNVGEHQFGIHLHHKAARLLLRVLGRRRRLGYLALRLQRPGRRHNQCQRHQYGHAPLQPALMNSLPVLSARGAGCPRSRF